MKMSPEKLQAFRNLTVSIRHLKFFNPMEFRPGHQHPFTMEVNYTIRGNPIDGHEASRAITIQECTDIINLSLLDESEEVRNDLYDLIYSLKSILQRNIEVSLGLRETTDEEPESGDDSEEG